MLSLVQPLHPIVIATSSKDFLLALEENWRVAVKADKERVLGIYKHSALLKNPQRVQTTDEKIS